MDKIIYISVVLVFCIIVYKHKISPIVTKKKDTDSPAKTPGTVKEETVSSVSPLTDVDRNGFIAGGVLTKYQILAFDYTYDALTPFEFADRVQSRLSVSLSQIAELGCPYRVDYITLGTALILLISYQVIQPLPVPRTDAP
jgi:hypothetical protein